VLYDRKQDLAHREQLAKDKKALIDAERRNAGQPQPTQATPTPPPTEEEEGEGHHHHDNQ
jgi:hypothetical protein